MLPDGWSRMTVGHACSIKNNLRMPINTEQRASMPGPYPYFGPTGILAHIDHYRIDEEFAIIGEDGDHFLKFREKPMTLHFDGRANVNNHAHVIGDSEYCSPKWFYYWFMHRDLTASLSRQGVGRYKLTKKGLSELEIWLPPKLEQKRVTDALATWDQAIATAERLLTNSRTYKQALVDQHLLKPAFSRQWPVQSIKEVSDRIQRQAVNEEGLPVLMISSGQGFVRQDEKYSKFMAGKSVNNYITLGKGEFAYNKGNSKLYEFGCVFQLQNIDRGLVPHVYVCFRLRDQCHPEFYRHLFAADYLHDQLGALVNTGVRNNGLLNIRPADFLGCEVPVPPKKEQVRLAGILQTATSWVLQHEAVLDQLKQEKAALMAQLLTGKRRVRLPEDDVIATP
ncbi:restriction endonuclease subunit S [Variovorax rhizosphaerae]|uniref:Restriction endonuclease subunit S n=1 Tax=Variovorax rhizosphaerae TaxID=1836200 RepID=A0ABU8WEN1_9BURK